MENSPRDFWKDVEQDPRRPWWSTSLVQLGPIVVGFFVLLGILTGFVPSPLLRTRETPTRDEVVAMIDHRVGEAGSAYQHDQQYIKDTVEQLRSEVHQLSVQQQTIAVEQARQNGQLEAMRAELRRR